MKKLKYIIPIGMLATPLVAFAATKTLSDLIGLIASYLDKILALMMGLAVVMFIFYVIQYFMKPSDKRAEGAQYVMWSMIGFFVIFCFWGILNIFVKTFDFGQNSPGSWSNFTNIFPK